MKSAMNAMISDEISNFKSTQRSLVQSTYLKDFQGFKNHINDVSGRLWNDRYRWKEYNKIWYTENKPENGSNISYSLRRNAWQYGEGCRKEFAKISIFSRILYRFTHNFTNTDKKLKTA